MKDDVLIEVLRLLETPLGRAAAARIEALTAEVERKDAALVNCAANLAAAISFRALPDAWQGMGSGEDLLFQPFHPKPLPEPPK